MHSLLAQKVSNADWVFLLLPLSKLFCLTIALLIDYFNLKNIYIYVIIFDLPIYFFFLSAKLIS